MSDVISLHNIKENNTSFHGWNIEYIFKNKFSNYAGKGANKFIDKKFIAFHSSSIKENIKRNQSVKRNK